MHFAISATSGPTDPTRALLPFIFAASAVQAGESVTLMLFHDAVYMRVKLGGMNEFHAAASASETRVISF